MQQNEHLELGRINTLNVNRHTPHGIFLEALDEKDVLLPQKYVTEEMQDETLVDVFLYTDSEDRLIATTETPVAMLDEFGFFEVVDTTKFGAFVNWGLLKDLLVPRQLQKEPFVVGEKKFLRVVYDEKTHRLVGTQKITKYLQKAPKSLRKNQEVKILLIRKTPLGFAVIVDDNYEGMIFQNEIFEKVAIGDTKTAYIKNVRSDGNLDISLQAIGGTRVKSADEKILALLEENSGVLPYNYKSDAELIKNVFGLSKKAFKASLTSLQNKGKIEVKENGIYLK